MPVRVECPECGKGVQAPSKYRGKKIKCPGCQEPLIVPEFANVGVVSLKHSEPLPPPLAPPVAGSRRPATLPSIQTRILIPLILVVACVSFGAWSLWDVLHTGPIANKQISKDVRLQTKGLEPTAEGETKWTPPFEYTILKEKSGNSWGADFHSFDIETSVASAKSATENDVRSIWENDLAKRIKDKTKASARFFIDTPGAFAWALISKMPEEWSNPDTKWKTEFSISDWNRDPDPYHFVAKIDRSVSWQKGMIISLPDANDIVAGLDLAGFSIEHRSVTLITLSNKNLRLDITVTPESIGVSSTPNMLRKDRDYWQAVQIALQPLGIWEEVLQKTRSVIGSPSYFAAEKPGGGNAMSNTWEIGVYHVRYSYFGKQFHDIDVSRN